ncbi:cupin domain-containing protein [Rhizobium sp. 9T]|uniref:cupin domain-containing protein n=1 Tax=Rhizobium croatiense TaxID=2867516 RepID=UPI001C931D8D|nr:cupin domain-containing protein [Rhizobium croatiense]MBY4606371.1 cupin domain-containing protein [Rhizobium croatiense]
MLDEMDREFTLNDAETETLRRAAEDRCLQYSLERKQYTRRELAQYGLVREAYTTEELRAAGFGPDPVTSFDSKAKLAQDLLRVDTPFGSGIKKWQLPVNMIEMRVYETVFPPCTVVEPHVHPINSEDDPGGSLRIVVKGSLNYQGQYFGPGDWFFVPNGVPYSFISDETQDTHVMYLYRFFAATENNRFSHPHAAAAE